MFYKLVQKFLQKVAVEHGVESELLLANPVVGDAIVRPVVRSDFVADVPRLNFRFLMLLMFLFLNFSEMGENALVQTFQGDGFVLMLVALVLALSFDSCRIVDDSHGRVSGVDVLATGA